MRVSITGASGHIASALNPEPLAAGHSAVGLARSDRSAAVAAGFRAIEAMNRALVGSDKPFTGTNATAGLVAAGFEGHGCGARQYQQPARAGSD